MYSKEFVLKDTPSRKGNNMFNSVIFDYECTFTNKDVELLLKAKGRTLGVEEGLEESLGNFDSSATITFFVSSKRLVSVITETKVYEER